MISCTLWKFQHGATTEKWRSRYALLLSGHFFCSKVVLTKCLCSKPPNMHHQLSRENQIILWHPATDKVILKSTFAFSFIQKPSNQWEGKIKIGYCSEYKCSDTRQEYDINVLPTQSKRAQKMSFALTKD